MLPFECLSCLGNTFTPKRSELTQVGATLATPSFFSWLGGWPVANLVIEPCVSGFVPLPCGETAGPKRA